MLIVNVNTPMRHGELTKPWFYLLFLRTGYFRGCVAASYEYFNDELHIYSTVVHVHYESNPIRPRPRLWEKLWKI